MSDLMEETAARFGDFGANCVECISGGNDPSAGDCDTCKRIKVQDLFHLLDSHGVRDKDGKRLPGVEG
jgi:hypothetical protein